MRHYALEWDLVSASDGGLSFALSVPRPGRRVAKVDGLVQTAPRVEVGNRCVTFRWSGVTDDEGCRLPISVETRARIVDGFLLFDATVENKSDRTIEMVAWPQLHAIRPLHPGGTLRHMDAEYDFIEIPAVPVQVGIGGCWGQHQPETSRPWSRASFCLLQGTPPAGAEAAPAGGWYVGLHESPRRRLVIAAFEQRPGTLDSYSLLMSEESVHGRRARPQLDLWRGMLTGNPKGLREMWNGGDWSHAWGGTPLYQLSRRVLGVEPAGPDWDPIRLRPQPLDLAWARGVVPTPHGDLQVAWQRRGGDLIVRLDGAGGRSVNVAHGREIAPEGGRRVFVCDANPKVGFATEDARGHPALRGAIPTSEEPELWNGQNPINRFPCSDKRATGRRNHRAKNRMRGIRTPGSVKGRGGNAWGCPASEPDGCRARACGS